MTELTRSRDSKVLGRHYIIAVPNALYFGAGWETEGSLAASQRLKQKRAGSIANDDKVTRSEKRSDGQGNAPLANILHKNPLKARAVWFDINARAIAAVVSPMTKKPAAIGCSQHPVAVPHVAAELADVYVQIVTKNTAGRWLARTGLDWHSEARRGPL